MKPILSARDLAWRLGTPLARLRKIADEISSDMYAHYSLQVQFDKKKQKVRHLRVPRPELKEIQRRIHSRILARIPIGQAAQGGVSGRSPHTNAAQHVGQPIVVTLDVKDFFPSVRHYFIHRLFRHELGFGSEAASLLTRLTTLDGQLPQGTPTSTTLANLLLATSVDRDIAAEADRLNASYTRFVDDMTFSGAKPQGLITVAARSLSRKRLRVHRPIRTKPEKSKLKISPKSVRQEVTGLIVNSPKGPSISRARRDNIRAAIFQLPNIDGTIERAKAIATLRGKIFYVRRTNPRSFDQLMKLLDRAVGADRL